MNSWLVTFALELNILMNSRMDMSNTIELLTLVFSS